MPRLAVGRTARRTETLRRLAGFTLWELLWTLLVAASCSAIGVPSFRTFRARRAAHGRRQRLRAGRRSSRAARRSSAAGPWCLRSADLSRCGDDPESAMTPAGSCSSTRTTLRPPQRSAAEPLLSCTRRDRGHRSSPTVTYFEFRPFRRRSIERHGHVLRPRGPTAARAVIVSYTGPAARRLPRAGRHGRCMRGLAITSVRGCRSSAAATGRRADRPARLDAARRVRRP